MKPAHALLAGTLLLSVTSPTAARAETDGRDYEALAVLPSETTILLTYYRHITSADTENLTEDVAVFRGVYTLKFGDLSIVPIDFILPVADASVVVVTGAASSLTLTGSGIGDLTYLPTIGYTIPEEKGTYTYLAASLYFTLPTGSYEKTQAVNIGGNRYTFEPELAIGQRYENLNFELVGNLTAFNHNDSVANPMTGATMTTTQDDSFALAIHASMDITPTVYFGTSYYFYRNGATHVEGSDADLMPVQKVNAVRFTVGLALNDKTRLLLQFNQDIHDTDGASITRWFGARLATHF